VERLEEPMPDSLTNRIQAVELLLLDVDGVLTDGTITYTDSGDQIKQFHVRDGSAIKFWQQSGKQIAILSGRSSPAVARRAKELGIERIEQGASNKWPVFERLLSEFALKPEQVCAIGDDLPDLAIVSHCGVGIAVADACPELRQAAKYVTSLPGGRGAVREAIEWLMRAQGTWESVVELHARVPQ
jgi:3-deoxy-D-manno-octulosonate 8-phosphate phosphatase (KDO 8-P phosphatase)